MPNHQESSALFAIGSSRSLKLVNNGLHTLAILACWLNDLPVAYKLTLSLTVIASWCYYCNKAVKTHSILLKYTETSGWSVSSDHHVFSAIKIIPTTTTGKMLTILHIRMENHRKSFVILKDAMTTTDYRRFQVLLKISA